MSRVIETHMCFDWPNNALESLLLDIYLSTVWTLELIELKSMSLVNIIHDRSL